LLTFIGEKSELFQIDLNQGWISSRKKWVFTWKKTFLPGRNWEETPRPRATVT